MLRLIDPLPVSVVKGMIDAREDDASGGGDNITDNKVKDLDSNAITDISYPSSAVQSQMSNSNYSLAYIGIQIRKATAAIPAPTNTNNLSHHPHLSQTTNNLTTEMVTRFFHDDPESLYFPLPPHKLEESPCKSIIRVDNHSFYYCTLHPDIQNIHLESVEHHCKYQDREMHKSEIIKSLGDL
jgi:hypothetical protein